MPAYAIDPATGMPLLQTPGGGGLPLPLSPEEMAQAGAQQVPPWAQQGPALPPELQGLPPGALAENAQASPGSRSVRRDAPMASMAPSSGGRANYSPEQIQQMNAGRDAEAAKARSSQLEAERAELDAKAKDPAFKGNSRAMAGLKVAQDRNRAQLEETKAKGAPGKAAGGAVDPSELAMPGGGSEPTEGASQGGGGMDPTVEQVFREALSRGGGGGGRPGLRVTGQTAKYFMPGEVPEEVGEEAQGARMAREGYDLEMADRADARREQLYAARQAEAAYRMAEMDAQRTRQAEQQRMQDEYSAKRDALVEEAAALKSPDMEDYWGSKSTFAQMMTAASIAIGGALQGLRGGPNPGLEMSNQAIDRWIVGKREEYSRAKDRADFADNKFARMVDTFGSENLAAANLREQAHTVRDGMLIDYAEQMGTAPAKDAAQQLLLAQQQQRAEAKAQAYAAAGKEIEEKLQLTGGGGGGSPRLLKALGDAAAAKKYLDEINGTGGGGAPTREVQNEKVEAVTGALDALTAAAAVQKHLGKLGYSERDADDPTTGLLDRAANAIPGTDTRRMVQDLEQDTFNLARGAQLSLGKSDNDARLAEQWAAGGGGSGRERARAAQNIAKKSLGRIQDTLSSLTPNQRAAFVKSLPPERRQQLQEALGSVAAPRAASSEQAVTVE
jgi:hypothetical protein